MKSKIKKQKKTKQFISFLILQKNDSKMIKYQKSHKIPFLLMNI